MLALSDESVNDWSIDDEVSEWMSELVSEWVNEWVNEQGLNLARIHWNSGANQLKHSRMHSTTQKLP